MVVEVAVVGDGVDRQENGTQLRKTHWVSTEEVQNPELEDS